MLPFFLRFKETLTTICNIILHKWPHLKIKRFLLKIRMRPKFDSSVRSYIQGKIQSRFLMFITQKLQAHSTTINSKFTNSICQKILYVSYGIRGYWYFPNIMSLYGYIIVAIILFVTNLGYL